MTPNGEKVWELRNGRCHRRGRIALACAGTALLYGEVDLLDCILVARTDAGCMLVAAGSHEDFSMLPR